MKRAGRYLRGVALIALCILAAGCFPYAYPKLSRVPSAELGSEASEIHVFRVDAKTNPALFGFSDSDYQLTAITPRPDGTVPSQYRVTIERRVAHPTGQFYYFSGGSVHETLVRLYRPGYHLVELKSWDSTDTIDWRPAPDWHDQALALTGLLALPGSTLSSTDAARSAQGPPLPSTNPSLQLPDYAWKHLIPSTPTTRQAMLVFDVALAECERLEKCAPTAEDAASVRMLADKLIERKSKTSTFLE
jgi:hypothetical protein